VIEVRKGDVVRMTSFTHVNPDSQFTFKAPKGRVAVFLLLGEEAKDGSNPLDLVARMKEFGWVPATEKKNGRKTRRSADPA
jgi:hypothetical protein